MCLISVKMQNQKFNDVLRMDGKKLFERATKIDRIVFYKFYDWIQSEASKVIQLWRYKRHLRLQRQKKSKPVADENQWAPINCSNTNPLNSTGNIFAQTYGSSNGHSLFKPSCSYKNDSTLKSPIVNINVQNEAMAKGKKLDLNILKFNNYF